MRKLNTLTRKGYDYLLKSGMFWEIYSKATGIYEVDQEQDY